LDRGVVPMHMSDELVDLPPDKPPRSGSWVDLHDDVLEQITPEEIDAGERLNELIDVDDDDDNGLQHIGGPDR
jgi:hypothetical protein